MAISTDQILTAGLRAAPRIAAAWQLTDEQLGIMLGSPDHGTFERWLAEDAVGPDSKLYERLSCMLGIYKTLHTLYSRNADADGWLWRRNDYPLFGGTQPVHRMLSGEVSDLQLVREHLDGALQW